MFTGLIEQVGTIKHLRSRGTGIELGLTSAFPRDEVALGDSIAVDGVCLTVTAFLDSGFTVDVSPESLARTALGQRRPGHRVNLERALRVGDRLGGHIVSGHVDGTGTVTAITEKTAFVQIGFTASQNILKYIITKGSIAIDGISLTVNSCSAQGFDVMIIPHTFARTTLADRRPGDTVNLENDIIGKYVEKLFPGSASQDRGISEDFLKQHNFL